MDKEDSNMEFKIHPSIGISRLGNSPEQFCLSPEKIGQLPFEADQNGNKQGPIISFKDDAGRVRRQGQVFKVFLDNGEEVTLDTPNIKAMEWSVHLANKKATWYQYSELQGNLLYGSQNSYSNQNVPFRNPDVDGERARQNLIVDPGPRTIGGPMQSVGFEQGSAPDGYPVSYPPKTVKYGTPVLTLGDLYTDNLGRLIVVGGYGHAGGNEPLTSYGGSNTWHDDISDGPVYCTVSFKDNIPDFQLQAWVVVGSPDFAPEIVNISTLDDSAFDVGIREFNLVPDLCFDNIFNERYQANYQYK